VTAALSWLATYLVHSTALLSAAWLVDRLAGRRLPAIAETAWRAALVGGLLSATLHSAAQPGLVLRPLAARAAPPAGHGMTTAATVPLPTAGPASQPHPSGLSTDRVAHALPSLAAIGWASGAVLLLVRLGASAAALRELLRRRRPRPPGRLVRRLARSLGVRRPVAVSTSMEIPVPFTTGVLRPEVCCPERLFAELPGRLQEGILAHELAHVRRRDVAWRRAVRGLEAVLWPQPLLRVARRRLEALGETRCDLLAAACTGRPRELASCLVEVAAWIRTGPAPLAAMAPGAGLDDRVRRLLEEPVTDETRHTWSAPAAAAAMLLLAICLPALSFVDAAPAAPPPPSAAESEPATAPPAPEATGSRSTVAAPGTAAVAPAAASPAPAAPPAPAPGPDPLAIEDAIVEGLVSKAVLAEDADPDEVRRIVEEIVAREVARRETERHREIREEERRVARERREIERERARELERRVRDEAEAAARGVSQEQLELRVQELVERRMAERLELEELARELADDEAGLDADAAELEARARALAEEQERLREEVRRLAEEATTRRDDPERRE